MLVELFGFSVLILGTLPIFLLNRPEGFVWVGASDENQDIKTAGEVVS